MLNPVPFARSRSEMANSNRDFKLIRQFLELNLPKAHAVAVAASASAVINSRLALWCRFLPIVDHQRRIALTVKGGHVVVGADAAPTLAWM